MPPASTYVHRSLVCPAGGPDKSQGGCIDRGPSDGALRCWRHAAKPGTGDDGVRHCVRGGGDGWLVAGHVSSDIHHVWHGIVMLHALPTQRFDVLSSTCDAQRGSHRIALHLQAQTDSLSVLFGSLRGICAFD